MADGKADEEEVQEIGEAGNTAWLYFVRATRPASDRWSDRGRELMYNAFMTGFCRGVEYGVGMQQRLWDEEDE